MTDKTTPEEYAAILGIDAITCEEELRMWCVEQAVEIGATGGGAQYLLAEAAEIYAFVMGQK